jgi:hypothetical protein
MGCNLEENADVTTSCCAEHAIMKSFTLQGDQHRKEQKFVAYMLPMEDPVQRNSNEPSSSRSVLCCTS